MTTIPPALIAIAGIVINFLLIYAAYIIIARKRCTRASILKATAIVTAATAAVTALTLLLPDYIPGGCDIITAIMLIYHCGRSILKIERKPAIYAALIFFGLLLAVAFIIAAALIIMMN